MELGEYLARIPSYHSTQPRFMNTVATLIQPLVDAMAMLDKLTTRDFDLDTAVGVQLDMVGQWLGRDRWLRMPFTDVFFSLDLPEDRVGFDQGIWLGPYDARDGLRALDDDNYRVLLKLYAIANQWPGYHPPIVNALNAVWPGVVVDDRGDKPGEVMRCDVLIPGPAISTVALFMLQQDYPIKASGVRYNFLETTVSSTPLFGFDSANQVIAGFDVGAWGKVVYTS
jgi:hypothetical protein